MSAQILQILCYFYTLKHLKVNGYFYQTFNDQKVRKEEKINNNNKKAINYI